MAASFGKYLREHDVIGRRALEEATQVMVVFGGRLGTILVEAGHLTTEQVEGHLAAYLDLPSAPQERLAHPDPDALALLTAEKACRYSAFPMWVEKRTLHVAMLDAHDPDSVDHLAFETNLAITPYIVAERRLVDLLEKQYGVRPDPRFTDYRILEMAGHYRLAGEESKGEKPPTGPKRASGSLAQPEVRERAALGITPLEEGEELSDADEFGGIQGGIEEPAMPIEALASPIEQQRKPAPELGSSASAPGAARLQPARGPAEIGRLEAELALLAPREQIQELALRIATYFANTAALFVVHDGMIQGMCAGGDAPTQAIDAIYLPVESDNFLSKRAREPRLYRGRPTNSGIDASVMRQLCASEPKEVAVLPVLLGGRVVHLLYVDNGNEHIAESSLAALEVLCGTIGAAYTRLVVECRLRHC